MPTITPATHSTQQTQPRLLMAIKTIARTLAKGSAQPDTAQQISQYTDKPRRLRGSICFGADQLRTLDLNKAQIRATLINAFHRCLQCLRGGGPLDNKDPRDEGSKPSDDKSDGAGL